jgi:hypothetical protein
VQVPYSKEVAIHVVPESCAAVREARCEALTGVRVGQPSSREMEIYIRVPTPLLARKATRASASSQAHARPGEVKDPGMHVRSLHGNREICGLTRSGSDVARARVGKARSRSR